VEQAELGLAHVGLSEADIRRLRAMLMMALADGTLRARWTLTDAQHAHVVILGVEALDRRESFAADGRIVVVLVGAADRVPPGTRTLTWPIRAETLLALLKETEGRTLSRSSVDHTRPLIQLAELLRPAPRETDSAQAWRVTGLARAPIYVAPHRRQFFCSESLRSVHRFDARKDIELTPLAPAELSSVSDSPKPLVMLQWSVGLLTGAYGLLPWLDASATLRLQRFPEFQVLHHEPVHRRLAAAFSRPVDGVDAAIELTKLDRRSVCSFLNGADLCGYLRTSAPGDGAASAPARTVSGSKRSLVQLLRRALGIEALHG
jgi:hypothetical protein